MKFILALGIILCIPCMALCSSVPPPPACFPETMQPIRAIFDRSTYPRVFPGAKLVEFYGVREIPDFERKAVRIEGQRYIVPDRVFIMELQKITRWSCVVDIEIKIAGDTEPWKIQTKLESNRGNLCFMANPDIIRKGISELRAGVLGEGIRVIPLEHSIWAGLGFGIPPKTTCEIQCDGDYPVKYLTNEMRLDDLRGAANKIVIEQLDEDTLFFTAIKALEIPPGTTINGTDATWEIGDTGRRIRARHRSGYVDWLRVETNKNFDALVVLPRMKEILACQDLVVLRNRCELRWLSYAWKETGEVIVKARLVNPARIGEARPVFLGHRFEINSVGGGESCPRGTMVGKVV